MSRARFADVLRRVLAIGTPVAALTLAAVAPAHAACPDPTVPLQATIKFQDAPADAGFSALPAPTPVKIVIQVENCSGAPVLTGEGFSSTDFFRRLYFTNEGIVINKAEETLHADAPTFFCNSRAGLLLAETIPVVPVEKLAGPQGEPSIPHFFREYVIEDARKLYDLSAPGHYSVTLQFDLLTFDQTITDCDQFRGSEVVNVADAPGRHAFTIASNTLDFMVDGGAANSDIAGTSPVVADGVDASIVTITLRDAHNSPLAGVVPTFSATGSNNTLGPCSASSASGVSTCTLRSTTAEVKTLSIVTPVAKTGGTVTFGPGLGAATVWVGLVNSDDVGIKFDLLAIVRSNGAPIGSGQLPSVSGGSSGFNNAVLSRIPLALIDPSVNSGDVLSVELLVRNACTGSGKGAGRARLWFDGAAVDTGANRDAGTRTQLTATDAAGTYFLHAGGALSEQPGASRTSVDRQVDARCGSYQSFGTWSITLP